MKSRKMNICVKKFRQNSWRTAIDQRYISAIDMFLRKDCENITVSDQDLKILNSINLDYFDLIIEKKTKIKRSYSSSVNKVLNYFCSEADSFHEDAKRKYVEHIDLFNVYLDKGLPNPELHKIILNIENSIAIKEVVGLVVIKNNYLLIESLIKTNYFKYNSTLVVIALEYDSLEVVFMLRNEFSQEFSEDEHLFVNSIISAFSKSNYCWLAKTYLVK